MYFSKQLHATLNQAPRQTHVDDHAWINHDQRKATNGKSNGRRSAPIAPHQQELHTTRQPMSHHHQDQHSKHGQHRSFDLSSNKPHRTFVDLK